MSARANKNRGAAQGLRAAHQRLAPGRANLGTIEVAIVELAAGGDGLGRIPQGGQEAGLPGERGAGQDVGREAGGEPDAGKVAFVAYAAPGDRVRARVLERKKSFVRGEVTEILEPSPERVDAPCPYFVARTCGGCQWQHVSQGAQLRAKEHILANGLRHEIARGMQMLPIVAEVPAYGWRRRARLHVVRPGDSARAVIGFMAPRSHRVTDIEECMQLSPALADVLAVLRADLAPALTGRGEIELVAGHTGQAHVVIHGQCAPDAAAALVGKGGAAGRIAGVALETRLSDGKLKIMRWGEHEIEVEPGLRGRANVFAQASEAGNRALLAAVEQACGPREGLRIVELHAGAGNFTRILAQGARELLAADSHPPAWLRTVRKAAAEQVARELAEAGERVDLVVLDPPRTGAAELMAPLLALRPGRIVYVSCDPATLARDLGELTAGGYRAAYAQPVELMPQTAHVEVVVRLDAV